MEDSTDDLLKKNEELTQALIDARDTLLLMSLIDKTNTCDKAVVAADEILGVKNHKVSISLLDK